MKKIVAAVAALAVTMAFPGLAQARNLGHGHPVSGQVSLTDDWQCVSASGPELPSWYSLLNQSELERRGYTEARQELAATNSYKRPIPANVLRAIRHGHLVEDSSQYCVYGPMAFTYEGTQKIYCLPGDQIWVNPCGPCRVEVWERDGAKETWTWTLGLYYAGCGNEYRVWIPHRVCSTLAVPEAPCTPGVVIGQVVPVQAPCPAPNVSFMVPAARISIADQNSAGQQTLQSVGGPSAMVGIAPRIENNNVVSQSQSASASQSQGQNQDQAQSQSQSQSQAESQSQAQGQVNGPAGQPSSGPSGS